MVIWGSFYHEYPIVIHSFCPLALCICPVHNTITGNLTADFWKNPDTEPFFLVTYCIGLILTSNPKTRTKFQRLGSTLTLFAIVFHSSPFSWGVFLPSHCSTNFASQGWNLLIHKGKKTPTNKWYLQRDLLNRRCRKRGCFYFYFATVLIQRASDIEASISSRSDKSTPKSIYHFLFC